MLNKNRLLFFLKSLISFGLLFALLWIMRGSIKNILEILKTSNKIFFGLAFLLNATLTLFLSLRLRLLMSGQKIALSLKDAFYLTYIGYFFNNFLPTAIGGDIAKAYYASKKTDNNVESYAAVVTDRLCGLASILMIALVGLMFFGNSLGNKKIIWAVIAMATLIISLIALLLNKRIEHKNVPVKSGLLNALALKFSKLYNAVNAYKGVPLVLIKAILISLISHAGAILSIYLFILSLGGGINYIKLFLIVPLVWTVSMLPSLNGLGVREGAFVYFLKGDLGTDMAFTVSLLWLGVVIAFGIIGGVLHLLYPVKIKK